MNELALNIMAWGFWTSLIIVGFLGLTRIIFYLIYIRSHK